MECSLAALVLCFSWSNLYVGATGEYIDQPARSFTDTYYGETLQVFTTGGEEYIQRNVIREFDSSNRAISNPYASASIGYEIDLRSFRIDLSGFYRESAKISDNAEKGVALSVKWFPMRRH